MKVKPIAVLCSDLHIGSLKPACRGEEDWFAVQRQYLSELIHIAGDMPIVCAGDIFDRWNPNPETINFALRNFPHRRIFCVPGQHDLPNHRLDQVHRSGYGVLCAAERITDITGQAHRIPSTDVVLHGFAWGQEITPMDASDVHLIHVAVIHAFCFLDQSTSYPGAPAGGQVKQYRSKLRGYNAAVFGDNHKHFISKAGKCNVVNTGGFIRRKSNEVTYQPRVAYLMSDGTVESVELKTSRDKILAGLIERDDEAPVGMHEFIRSVEELGEHGLNFTEAVENYLRQSDLKKPAKEIILKAIES